jgi:hypothetical protein
MKRMREGTPKREENLAKMTPIRSKRANSIEIFSIEKSM